MWGGTSTAIRMTPVSMSTVLQGLPGCLGDGWGCHWAWGEQAIFTQLSLVFSIPPASLPAPLLCICSGFGLGQC